MKLSVLLEQLPHQQLINYREFELQHITHDSRKARPDGLFVALRGQSFDGRQFIADCSSSVVLLELCKDSQELISSWTEAGKTLVVVDDARASMATAAAILYGHPARSLKMVGLTGTNGKTTTAWILEQMLQRLGSRVGVIGTLGHRLNGLPIQQQDGHTTPESCDLQAIFSDMLRQGCDVCIMEVSSIGLDMHRVDAVDFDCAAFISFSQDHLDYHESMETYLECKRELFRHHLHSESLSLLSAQDPKIKETEVARGASLFISSGSTHSAPAWCHSIEHSSPKGTAFNIEISDPLEDKQHALWLPIIGAHNVENSCFALGIAHHLGFPLSELTGALANIPPPPGRMERCPAPEHTPDVFVDYAHTPEALELALQALRPLTTGQLFVVFGCGGDRDQSKRPQMGEIASRLADQVLITSDNPRSEDPTKIIEDISAGVLPCTKLQTIEDRGLAIQAAISAAQTGDVVLIAGKGHEQNQTIGNQVLPFDDRQQARLGIEQWLSTSGS